MNLVRKLCLVILFAACSLLVGCSEEEPTTVDDHDLTLSNTSNLPFLTGSYGVASNEVDYGPAQGYHARPTGFDDAPGIILIHEWWGLNDHIRATAEKLATHGYSVLAVDLYNGSTASTSSDAAKLSGSVDRASVLRNLRAAKAHLRSKGSNVTASLGFCFGGDQSMRFAYDEQRPDATVIFYGQPELNRTRLQRIDQPLLGVYGTNDSVVPIDDARSLDASLDNVTRHELLYYDGAEHAFANPSGESFNEEAAEQAWNETLTFFEAELNDGSRR